MYSSISQKENALSLRDNAELKKISVNQSRVALAASRDSAAMRVIAAITVLFLPATFTAVSTKDDLLEQTEPSWKLIAADGATDVVQYNLLQFLGHRKWICGVMVVVAIFRRDRWFISHYLRLVARLVKPADAQS